MKKLFPIPVFLWAFVLQAHAQDFVAPMKEYYPPLIVKEGAALKDLITLNNAFRTLLSETLKCQKQKKDKAACVCGRKERFKEYSLLLHGTYETYPDWRNKELHFLDNEREYFLDLEILSRPLDLYDLNCEDGKASLIP